MGLSLETLVGEMNGGEGAKSEDIPERRGDFLPGFLPASQEKVLKVKSCEASWDKPFQRFS
jgi:hypothetical protein